MSPATPPHVNVVLELDVSKVKAQFDALAKAVEHLGRSMNRALRAFAHPQACAERRERARRQAALAAVWFARAAGHEVVIVTGADGVSRVRTRR